MQVTFIDRRQLCPGVWEYTFLPEVPVEYVPGQYAHFQLPGLPHERARAFSLTSHPSENELQFITRLIQPLSVFKQTLSHLRAGDVILMDEPMGDSILPRLPGIPVVFVAQGIALASYLAMLTDLCERLDLAHSPQQRLALKSCARSNLSQREVTLLWVRRGEDDPLENLIPGEIPHFQRVDVHYPSRLRAADVLPHVSDQSIVYLSGSQRFVESLGTKLEASGISRTRLVYDYYDGYASC